MVVMTMAMSVASANCLGKIRDVGELAAGRGIREVGGERGELARRGGIALILSGLRGGLQIRGDLLGNLRVLGGIGLLQLLERAQQLGERRKLATVLLPKLLPDRRRGAGLRGGRIGCPRGVLKGFAKKRF